MGNITVQDFVKLRSLLDQVRNDIVGWETTIFAVGSRGYYENPTSDLLAFFLKPTGTHGLKDLFLSTFLECMELDSNNFNLSDVTSVKREVQTITGKFIDIQILGTDWCLIIENKILHHQNNPFKDYEAHAKSLGKLNLHYAILSPEGQSEAHGWIGVSYNNYCTCLKKKLPKIDIYTLSSKWWLFAREFILHIENLILAPIMNSSQAKQFENNAHLIAEMIKQEALYRNFIKNELNRRLNESLPGCGIFITEDKWAEFIWVFRCRSQKWAGNDLVLFKPEQVGGKYLTRFYLHEPAEQLFENAGRYLAYMVPDPGRTYSYWTSPEGFNSSEEAIDELCKLAKIMNDLLNSSEK